jgi:hypothetical protein
MNNFPCILLTKEMIEEALLVVPKTTVNRTVASAIDTLTGILGEYVFAQWFYGDWKKNNVGINKGKTDFSNVEIKTSAFPLNCNLHLLVREDYAVKRKPAFYVQIIIDVPTINANTIAEGTRAYLCGFATAKEVDEAPLKDFGSKWGNAGGYRCRFIPIKTLRAMNEFVAEYQRVRKF